MSEWRLSESRLTQVGHAESLLRELFPCGVCERTGKAWPETEDEEDCLACYGSGLAGVEWHCERQAFDGPCSPTYKTRYPKRHTLCLPMLMVPMDRPDE